MSPTSRIECGHIYRIGLWSGVANQGRILSIDEKLLFGKSRSEIEVIIKPMINWWVSLFVGLSIFLLYTKKQTPHKRGLF